MEIFAFYEEFLLLLRLEDKLRRLVQILMYFLLDEIDHVCLFYVFNLIFSDQTVGHWVVCTMSTLFTDFLVRDEWWLVLQVDGLCWLCSFTHLCLSLLDARLLAKWLLRFIKAVLRVVEACLKARFVTSQFTVRWSKWIINSLCRHR